MNLALDKSDVQILFDNATVCAVTEMTSDTIFCAIPPLEMFDITNETKHSVTVSKFDFFRLLKSFKYFADTE